MTHPVDWEAWIDAVAPAIGLPVAPGARPGVARFLGLASEMAAVVERVALAEDRLDLDAVLAPPEAR